MSPQTVRTAARSGTVPQGIPIRTPLQFGKYLVSPLPRPLAGGRFTAGVSIRCGAGSMTHDRILRFLPEFDCPEQAARYAIDQAMAWIGPSARADAPLAAIEE